jgi:hypothetical protein
MFPLAFCTELLASLAPFLPILFLDAPYALLIWNENMDLISSTLIADKTTAAMRNREA